jgi:hypothetical protein
MRPTAWQQNVDSSGAGFCLARLSATQSSAPARAVRERSRQDAPSGKGFLLTGNRVTAPAAHTNAMLVELYIFELLIILRINHTLLIFSFSLITFESL